MQVHAARVHAFLQVSPSLCCAPEIFRTMTSAQPDTRVCQPLRPLTRRLRRCGARHAGSTRGSRPDRRHGDVRTWKVRWRALTLALSQATSFPSTPELRRGASPPCAAVDCGAPLLVPPGARPTPHSPGLLRSIRQADGASPWHLSMRLCCGQARLLEPGRPSHVRGCPAQPGALLSRSCGGREPAAAIVTVQSVLSTPS